MLIIAVAYKQFSEQTLFTPQGGITHEFQPKGPFLLNALTPIGLCNILTIYHEFVCSISKNITLVLNIALAQQAGAISRTRVIFFDIEQTIS